MRKLIMCSFMLLVSLGFTKIEAHDNTLTESGNHEQKVEVKAEVPIKYTIEIPRELDLGSFNKTMIDLEDNIIREFNVKVRDAEIETRQSIFIRIKESDLSMSNNGGGSFNFQSSLTGSGLEFTHKEIYQNNNQGEKTFNISFEKNSIPSAGNFNAHVNFLVSCEASTQ